MSNLGKKLESLIKDFEQLFAPSGLNVLSNVPVYNDSGVSIAEFDIQIKGKLGETEINWLIMCRDRPSSGAAPVEWVEQLMGRRERFNFNKVMAVSTTGFSPGAVECAKTHGIILRTVRNITDIVSDYKVREFSCVFQDVNVIGLIDFQTIDITDKKIRNSKEVKFKLKNESGYFYIKDFILSHCDKRIDDLKNSKQTFVFYVPGIVDVIFPRKSGHKEELVLA